MFGNGVFGNVEGEQNWGMSGNNIFDYVCMS